MNRSGILDDFRHAFQRSNNAVVQLILINLVVWLSVIFLNVILTLSQNGEVFNTIMGYLMMPASVDAFITRPWTLVTYFFLHENFFHILFNMLFLYWFGRLIQEYLGSDKVVKLYVLGGLMGGLFYILLYNALPFFAERIDSSLMLGASAGVLAVTVGAATLMPNYTFFLLLIGPVKIKYIALFFVIMSFAQTTGMNAGGEIAHLGGAAIGFLYIRQLQKGTDWGNWITNFLMFVKSFFVRQPKMRVNYSRPRTRKANGKARASATGSQPPQEEIDAILDKISQSGYESLTKEEKQKLFNASKS